MNKLLLVKGKEKWAVFSPSGYVQFRTISDTKKEAKERVVGYHERGERTWEDYAFAGYTISKVVVDIRPFK